MDEVNLYNKIAIVPEINEPLHAPNGVVSFFVDLACFESAVIVFSQKRLLECIRGVFIINDLIAIRQLQTESEAYLLSSENSASITSSSELLLPESAPSAPISGIPGPPMSGAPSPC